MYFIIGILIYSTRQESIRVIKNFKIKISPAYTAFNALLAALSLISYHPSHHRKQLNYGKGSCLTFFSISTQRLYEHAIALSVCNICETRQLLQNCKRYVLYCY